MTTEFVLTEEQRATVTRAAQRLQRAVTSTERCDRRRVEAAVRTAYRVAGLAQPSSMIWMDSPIGGMFAAAALREPDLPRIWDFMYHDHPPPPAELWDRLWHQLTSQLDDVRRQRHGSTRQQLLGPLANPGLRWAGIVDGALHREVGRLLGDRPRPLGGRLWAWAELLVRSSLHEPLPSRVRWYGDEVFDPAESEVVCMDLVLGMIGQPAPRRHARTLAAAVAESGVWWPLDDAVVLTDRPTRLHLDGQDRLHHATGPALAYADGWAGHFWHGLPVPADLLDPGWPVGRILREPNLEVRRAAVERIGWDRFVGDAGLIPVQPPVPDPGNPGGELTLFDLPAGLLMTHGQSPRLLLCRNGTPEHDGTHRRFGLLVPRELTDPVEAAAWTYDIDSDRYRRLTRRA